MNSWDIFKDTMEVDLEKARKDLCTILAQYAHLTKQEVILVFDGYKVKKSPGAHYRVDGISVVFTKELQTADHYIEQELDKVGRLRRVRVATSDKIEQQIIMQRGGSRISARELLAEVEAEQIKLKRKTKEIRAEFYKNSGSMTSSTMEDLLELKKKLDK